MGEGASSPGNALALGAGRGGRSVRGTGSGGGGVVLRQTEFGVIRA